MRPKRFPRNVLTCWNSTYKLLNDSNNYKELLCDFIANNINDINLYPQYWDVCKSILDTLKVFNDATYTLSGVYYPKTHLVLTECINICSVLEEHENDLNLFSCIQAMKNKWLEILK